LDQSQYLLLSEVNQLRHRIESEPTTVLALAEKSLSHAKQIRFSDGIIQSLIVMSRAAWCDMDFRRGLKLIKEARQYQSQLDTDEYLPEILHIHALHYWGKTKYYSAQQYWLHALEQSALVDATEIQIESLIGLGNIWRITKQYDLASSTHQLAAKVAHNEHITWLEGKARILWSWDLYLLEQYLDMLTVLDGADEALSGYPDKALQAEVWDFRGLALLGLKRIEDAKLATQKAHNLAVAHNLSWMKAHSYISRARIEILRKDFNQAIQLLLSAEQIARHFDNGELLAQIFYQQSLVAEQQGNDKAALDSFKKYRQYSLNMAHEQSIRLGSDKARSSKRQLDQRARKLINQIKKQHEYNPEKHLSNVVPENYWWEQMVLHKVDMMNSSHSVVVIQHDNPLFLDACTELVHALCAPKDLLTRLSPNYLGLLIDEPADTVQPVFDGLEKMIELYPWERRKLYGSLPKAILYSILSFPFTLELLEEMITKEQSDGSTVK